MLARYVNLVQSAKKSKPESTRRRLLVEGRVLIEEVIDVTTRSTTSNSMASTTLTHLFYADQGALTDKIKEFLAKSEAEKKVKHKKPNNVRHSCEAVQIDSRLLDKWSEVERNQGLIGAFRVQSDAFNF